MGKIGLPIAVQFARKGNEVTGLDVDENTIEKINAGIEPFPGEKFLPEYLMDVIQDNKFLATLDKNVAIKEAEVIVVCIPLIINAFNEPDFSNFDNLVEDIGNLISKNTLISFETTLPVGTTRDRFAKIISRNSGFEVGKEIFIVFSPERVFTGRIFEDLAKYPKLVGGVTEMCTEKGVLFYREVLDFNDRIDLAKKNGVWALKNSETAEFAKIAETTYRDVNIALANEFSEYALTKKIDFSEIMEATNSQPYSHIHKPGISVGGHCIPVYSQFYLRDNSKAEITIAARKRNLSMPHIAINRVKSKINTFKDLKIGILGLSYRPGVKEVAFSGAFDLLEILKQSNAFVYGFDPYFTKKEIQDLGFMYDTNLTNLDGIFIHTDHPEFKNINYNVLQKIKFIFDGRNTVNPETILNEKIIYMNFENQQ